MIGGLLPSPGPVPRKPSRLVFLLAATTCVLTLLILSLWVDNQYRKVDVVRLLASTSSGRQAAASDLMLELTRAESAQRGYVITGHTAFLGVSRRALGHVAVDLSRLGTKDAVQAAETRDVARLRDVVAARLREMAIVTDLRQRQGSAAASARMSNGRGAALMDDACSIVDDLNRVQRSEMAGWQRLLAGNTVFHERLLRALMLLVTLLLLAGSAAFWRLRMRRYQSEQDAHEIAIMLREVFAGNADATLLLDLNGTIQAANAAAVRLFGYSYEELVGRNMLALLDATGEGDFQTRIGRVGSQLARAHWLDRVMCHREGHGVSVDIALGLMQLRNASYVIATIRDIGERKTIERLKDEFLANVSHELRTPLTSVIGALGLLRNGGAASRPNDAQRLIEIAENNSRRLIKLINDLLDIDRIGSGRMRFERATFDLAGTARAAVEDARGIADARAIRIELAAGQQPLFVEGDHHRLLQVLSNLLSNAIRASPLEGLVRVAIAREKETVVVTVDDQGSGVAPDLAPRIFERFAQASDAMPGGSGLGLAISREIVIAHGGRIWFGEAAGGGARFAFSLAAAPEQQSLRGNRSCILVGEANANVAERLRAMLHLEECDVECVATGREVLEAAQTGRYDVLVLESALPDGGGLETARALRRRNDTRRLPVIIMGMTSAEAVGAVGEPLEFVEGIAKPVDSTVLAAAVRRALERSVAIRPTLLHIDGDPDMLEIAAAVLAEHGRIVHATSLAAARVVLTTQSVDIVILDPNLSDGSGNTLIRELLQPDGTPIPTVIYSAIDVPPEVEHQVDAVLIKSRRSLASLARAIQGILATADDDIDPA